MCQKGAQSQASGHTGQISVGTGKSSAARSPIRARKRERQAGRAKGSAPLLRALRSVSWEAATLSSAGGSLQLRAESQYWAGVEGRGPEGDSSSELYRWKLRVAGTVSSCPLAKPEFSELGHSFWFKPTSNPVDGTHQHILFSGRLRV